ncbi:DUF4159 domain-containing protein [Consotaella salsifontis]
MGGLSLSFGAPLVLFGLLALPAIWWLLRLTPPKPQTETFPPLAILRSVLKTEETPQKTPWWLVLLRLLLAAAVIFALAAPTLNPRDSILSGSGPLALMIDNGWASGPDWDDRQATAEALIGEAKDAGRPVALAFTAEGSSDDATPAEADEALVRLRAAEPRPIPTDRAAAATRLSTALSGGAQPSLVLLTDGLDSPRTDDALQTLAGLSPEQAVVYRPPLDGVVGLTSADNSTEALVVQAVRPEGSSQGASFTVHALDEQGRELGHAPLDFAANASTAEARFDVPVELRNDIARLQVEDGLSAGAVRLVDDSFRRRRVALISGESSDLAQPLLSPLYYITRALQPFADLDPAKSADLATSVPELLQRHPSVVVLADIGVLPQAASEALQAYVENGGTLLRFAGPRLAAQTGEDKLVPVRLRRGERQLGGALSWAEPQHVAPMAASSPFAGIAIPDDVTVSRQVLAEPSSDLSEKTWASLADGTPLVTAETVGAGSIVLFHVTAEATWSNLPLSGAFVGMLRRVVSLSRAGGGNAGSEAGGRTLPPYRVLDGRGRLTTPGPDVEPLTVGAGEAPAVGRAHPPGLYGTEDGYAAVNLLSPDATLRPLPDVDLGAPVEARGYGRSESLDLMPWLFSLALILFALDALALLALNGGLARLRRRLSGGSGAAAGLSVVLLSVLVVATLMASPVNAQQMNDSAPQAGRLDVDQAIEATRTTHLAYVETGEDAVDEISRAGLEGLTRYIAAKTSLEPGHPIGVDIAADELAFYPLLYWPIEASAPMPDAAAISRVDAYMKNGGTVLFDIHDDALTDLSGAVSPAQKRLRNILADLDIPPLEPVPPDHVLTKSFYMMERFPGRHSGSELWVEALAADPEGAARPARGGDGVSSLMITSNDFASAWAIDDSGQFLYPTDNADPRERELAYRAGVNIMMYVLTGNYKADQVHLPALLERLGQ